MVDGLCPFTPHREDHADAEISLKQIHNSLHASELEHISVVERNPNKKPDSLISANPATIITVIVIIRKHLCVFAIFYEFADLRESSQLHSFEANSAPTAR